MAKMPEYHPVVVKLVQWTIRNGWLADETMSAFQVALQFAQTYPAEASWLMTQIRSAQEAFAPDLMVQSDEEADAFITALVRDIRRATQ